MCKRFRFTRLKRLVRARAYLVIFALVIALVCWLVVRSLYELLYLLPPGY